MPRSVLRIDPRTGILATSHEAVLRQLSPNPARLSLSASSPPHLSHSLQPHSTDTLIIPSPPILSLLLLCPLRESMGNLCGKESKDNFDGPGRTLGSAPAPATKASVPSSANAPPKRTVGGPPRTLGEGNTGNDPKAAAAAAAEVRSLESYIAPKKNRPTHPMMTRAWM